MAIFKPSQRNAVQDKIIETMCTVGNKHYANWQKNHAKEVENLLLQLEALFQIQKGDPNRNTYYSTKRGWAQYVKRINRVEDYAKAFQIVEKILDLIRGDDITIEVFSVYRDQNNAITSMKSSSRKESSAKLITNKEKATVEYVKQSLKKEIEYDEAFINHYTQFENVAKKRNFIKKVGKNKRTNINQGHIIEAYRRHLMWVKHTKDNNDPYVTDAKHVAIMLWYSVNSTGWWVGGDVGYTQVKAENNPRVATTKSIRNVASVLLEMYHNPEQFDPQRFKMLFTKQELDDMSDYDEMYRKPLKEIFDQKTGRFIHKK